MAAPVQAQTPSADRDEVVASGLPDAPAWWAEAGRPGYAPDYDSGLGSPWLLAGLVRGAWAIDDPELPVLGGFPGVMGVQTPLAWMDSLRVESGSESGWDGFEGALAKVWVRRGRPLRARARTGAGGDLVLGSGSDALDGNGLSVTRGDTASWWRTGALSWTRGGLGDLGPAGRHHYSLGGQWTRGRQRVSGTIAQAGSAAELVSGESQSVTGAGGSLRYQLALQRSALALELARGYDHHESFGGTLAPSRRDAHQRGASAEWIGADDAWGLRLDAREQWVTRVTSGFGATPWTARSWWLAGRIQGQREPAMVDASLGAGHHEGIDGTPVAPSLRMRFGDETWTAALHAGRVITPVWSDLAPGYAAFLQSTWNGGLDLGWRGEEGRQIGVGGLVGQTRGRALADRLPFEELWLRNGFRDDPNALRFGLATLDADWTIGAWSAHGEVYDLARSHDGFEPRLDPERGGRASLETSFRAFAGDLGVRVRAEVAGVGGHESPSALEWVPGYWTYGATAALTLADATITVRLRNLEDTVRPLPWIVPSTFADGVGRGLEFRLGMAWRLYN